MQDLLSLMAEADATGLAVEKAKNHLEQIKNNLETAKLELEQCKSDFSEIIAKAEELGISKAKLKKLVEERVAEMSNLNLMDFTVGEKANKKANKKAAKKPKKKKADQKKSQEVDMQADQAREDAELTSDQMEIDEENGEQLESKLGTASVESAAIEEYSESLDDNTTSAEL